MKYVDIFKIKSKEDKFFTEKQVEEFLENPIAKEIFETLRLRIVTILNEISSESKIDQVRMFQGSLQELDYFLELPELLKEENAKRLEMKLDKENLASLKKRK